ncbi:MAG: hypothetical protein WA058_00675 [Minisyncoccia bacterium]
MSASFARSARKKRHASTPQRGVALTLVRTTDVQTRRTVLVRLADSAASPRRRDDGSLC